MIYNFEQVMQHDNINGYTGSYIKSTVNIKSSIVHTIVDTLTTTYYYSVHYKLHLAQPPQFCLDRTQDLAMVCRCT